MDNGDIDINLFDKLERKYEKHPVIKLKNNEQTNVLFNEWMDESHILYILRRPPCCNEIEIYRPVNYYLFTLN